MLALPITTCVTLSEQSSLMGSWHDLENRNLLVGVGLGRLNKFVFVKCLERQLAQMVSVSTGKVRNAVVSKCTVPPGHRPPRTCTREPLKYQLSCPWVIQIWSIPT